MVLRFKIVETKGHEDSDDEYNHIDGETERQATKTTFPLPWRARPSGLEAINIGDPVFIERMVSIGNDRFFIFYSYICTQEQEVKS